MNKREFKDRVYSELAIMTKALGNAHRLEIIELLAQGEYSVERIAEFTNVPIANASQHLQVLKQAQLVDLSRDGNFIYYRLANENVFSVWRALRELGIARISSIDRLVKSFRKGKFDFETVTIDELVKKLESGKVTILDVRPETEYKQGHIASAISIPIEDLPSRLKELPKRTEIIAYCRGPFCVYADEAISILTKAGFKAKRLEEGFPDWKHHQLPIEVNPN